MYYLFCVHDLPLVSVCKISTTANTNTTRSRRVEFLYQNIEPQIQGDNLRRGHKRKRRSVDIETSLTKGFEHL